VDDGIVIYSQWGKEVKTFCKDGSKIKKNGKREKKMKLTMYACDGCEAPVKSKDEFENSIKVPTTINGKTVKKVKQLCASCNGKLQKLIAGMFK